MLWLRGLVVRMRGSQISESNVTPIQEATKWLSLQRMFLFINELNLVIHLYEHFIYLRRSGQHFHNSSTNMGIQLPQILMSSKKK